MMGTPGSIGWLLRHEVRLAWYNAAPGKANTNTPKMSDSTPLSARSHSPLITLRNRTAATSSSAPVRTAQAPMKRTSASAVTSGQMIVSTPAATPTTPWNTWAHDRPCDRPSPSTRFAAPSRIA